MNGGWTPELRVHETGTGCRLTLVGVTYGNGATLQEAADDLVVRVLNVVMGVRSSGFPARPGIGAPARGVLEFLWAVGDLAAGGHDVRPHILGVVDQPDPAAPGA